MYQVAPPEIDNAINKSGEVKLKKGKYNKM
jgi:hypothetical protein